MSWLFFIYIFIGLCIGCLVTTVLPISAKKANYPKPTFSTAIVLYWIFLWPQAFYLSFKLSLKSKKLEIVWTYEKTGQVLYRVQVSRLETHITHCITKDMDGKLKAYRFYSPEKNNADFVTQKIVVFFKVDTDINQLIESCNKDFLWLNYYILGEDRQLEKAFVALLDQEKR